MNVVHDFFSLIYAYSEVVLPLQVMKMMGLSNAVHWLAYFITTFVQFTVTMIVLTVMLKYGQVLTYSDPVIVFMTLELFGIATISFW